MNKLSTYNIEELNERLNNYLHNVENSNNPDSYDDIKLLLDDLHAHQIELEINNRQLIEAQNELEKSRDNYANLYDFSPIGYISFNEKGCIQQINLTACNMLAYDRTVVLGKPFSICLSLNDTRSFFNHIKTVLSSSEKHKITLTVKSKNGKYYRIELESIRHVDFERHLFIQSAIIDVSDRVSAEQERTAKESQLHSIIDALPTQVAYIDANEQYIFTNSAHDRTFPVKDGTYIGKKLRHVIGEEFHSMLQSHIISTLNGHEVICELSPLIDDRKTAFRINLLPQPTAQGLIDGFYLIMIDITVYKQKELDVMTHLSDIAHESRLNLIGQMTAEISHEINQPLAAIANYSMAGLHMQRSGNLKPDQLLEIFHEIDGQVHRASEIINHLKRFSKKREIRLARTNINALIVSVLRLMIIDEHWHGVELYTELDESIPYINADEVLIEQVLVNLLRNAIDAMIDSGQKKLTINIKTTCIDNDI
ncbi:MAG: PAS domain S-box protein, partial [Gammaproteobacteria bacterium]|nr:PAS domain S-box protein [Gammaproteobacteria bacterium]